MESQSNFIKTIMEKDLESKKHETIITRFPPEPNGYLHIGHARAIINNFELAKTFGGKTNLRFDDTNPSREEQKYVDSIIEDITWLGYTPSQILFASNYFQEMYERALVLIRKGLAFVCDLTGEEIANHRGDLLNSGIDSPYRNRNVKENIELFENMKKGQYPEGTRTLRAKIDMKSPNMNLRDPVIYRISFDKHHNTGNSWVIYPMYDYAHPIEDAIEGITHSLCSLEFEDHRPLYDWFVKHTEMPLVPRQIEFGRLGIENTVMSKRYLRALVEKNVVSGWDDPRMPTLAGLRRRGYAPTGIRNFILGTGLSRTNSEVSIDMLEHFIREDLAGIATRKMAILDPLKVTITNYPQDEIEYLEADNHANIEMGTRQIPFSRHLYIERDDFVVTKPNKKYKRLSLDDEVRLFNAYFIKCNEVIYNEDGTVSEILVTYDVDTKSGSGFSARKPNGTIHFVSADLNRTAEFRKFYPLLNSDATLPLEARYNLNSLEIKQGFVERSLKSATMGEKYQFMRSGYFTLDKDSHDDLLVFNEIVSLKSSYK